MDRVKKIKKRFRASDTNGDGTLQYDEFLAVLQRGKANFSEKEALILFRKVDTNGSGEIDFCEFVDFVFNNKTAAELMPDLADPDVEEQKAKANVLDADVYLRSDAFRAVNSSGGDWKSLSWKDRLAEINKYQSSLLSAPNEGYLASAEHPLGQHAPYTQSQKVQQSSLVTTESDHSIGERARENLSMARESPTVAAKKHSQSSENLVGVRTTETGYNAEQEMPLRRKSPQPRRRKTEPAIRVERRPSKAQVLPEESSSANEQHPPRQHCRRVQHANTVDVASMAAGLTSMDKSMMACLALMAPNIEFMSQAELVDYSIGDDDLEFAGHEHETLEELDSFVETLRTARFPDGMVDVERYLAKGKVGWVFEAHKKCSGEKVAMKLVRLTQARTAIREWYMSKLLTRAGGASGIVQTDDLVGVVFRDKAPAVIQEQLKDAGRVPYYCCLFQEFMNGGDLEREGLSLEVKFKCLADAAATLAYMHAQGMSHRDIKPANILLQEENGKVTAARLADFGCAEVSEEGHGEDIRRFGVTVFSLATGEPWRKNRLVREEHDKLMSRLTEFVKDASCPVLGKLPGIVEPMLNNRVSMANVSKTMESLRIGFVGF